MPVTNVGSKWVDGNLVLFNKLTGNTLATIDIQNGFVIANGATGTFEAGTKTVTVESGIITEIAEG